MQMVQEKNPRRKQGSREGCPAFFEDFFPLNGNPGLRYAHFEGMHEIISRSYQAKIAIQRVFSRQGKGCVGSRVVKWEQRRKESDNSKEQADETTQNVRNGSEALVSTGRA